MTPSFRVLYRNISAVTLAALSASVLLAGIVSSGCNSSKASGDSDSSGPKMNAAEIAAGKQRAIDGIKNNPNIPPQQKERIIAQMQGKFDPTKQPVGSPGAPAKPAN